MTEFTVYWMAEIYGTSTVEADSRDDAVEKARDEAAVTRDGDGGSISHIDHVEREER